MGPNRASTYRFFLLIVLILQAWVPLVDAMSCSDCLTLFSKTQHSASSYQAFAKQTADSHVSPDGNLDLCPGGVECCPVCANAPAIFLPVHPAPVDSVAFIRTEAKCTIVEGITLPVFRPPKLS